MAADAVVVNIARYDLCRFLSACYYEPSIEFVEERLFESILSVAEVLHPDLAAHANRLGKAFAAEELQTLLVDHTRLFVGPTRPLAMPYESFWLSGDGNLAQDATLAVQEIYQEGGFDLDEGFRDLPDHVAVELEFLYTLLFAQHQAIHGERIEEAAVLEELRQRFLREHLGKWVLLFTAAVRDNAETVFYRELAGFTADFMRVEIEHQF